MAKAKKKPAEKREEIRDILWPDAAELIWHRKTNDGFTTIPRVLPLILVLIQQLCQKEDPSPVYFDLWARNWDEGIIEIDDIDACAYSSGYLSNRAVRSWQERIWKLAELGFIKVEAKGNRKIGYILILNPLLVCAQRKAENKWFPDGWWAAFVQRTQEIGAEIPEIVPAARKPILTVTAAS
jgi:hypothetical protein